MSSILTIALKDLRLMRRDWLGLFFILGFPLLMGLFFGLVMGSIDTGSAKLNIAVVDEDGSEASRRFITTLEKSGNAVVHQVDDRAAATERVRRGELVGLIVIPKSFGKSAGAFWKEDRPAIGVGVDPSRQAEAGLLQGLVMQASGELLGDFFQNPQRMKPLIDDARKEIEQADDIPATQRVLLSGMMSAVDQMLDWNAKLNAAEAEDAEQNAGGQISRAPSMELARIEAIDVRYQPGEEPLVKRLQSKWDISFPQAMMWGVLGCAAGFAVSLVRERTGGTMVRLNVAPITKTHILAGKGLACFLAVVGVIAAMTALGYVLGMRPRQPLYLAAAALCIAVCFVGIMLLMSVLGRTEEAVSGAAWGVGVVMAMFGGGMIPLAFMPPWMQNISNFSPIKWGVLAMEGAIWRGFDLSQMLLPCGVLLAVGIACFAAGVWMLSKRGSA
jgi:ABC-2 type transport system permease protein